MREIRLHPKPLLSVLICHLPERKEKLNRLLNQIFQQVKDYPIEILVNDGEGSTGKKRNELLDAAIAPYVKFDDDDDTWSESMLDRIFPYIYEGIVDSIGFILGLVHKGEIIFRIYCCNAVTELKTFKRTIFRPITHICITRRELAVRFPDTSHGEDIFWQKEMIPILKDRKSAFIDEVLYLYNVHEA